MHILVSAQRNYIHYVQKRYLEKQSIVINVGQFKEVEGDEIYGGQGRRMVKLGRHIIGFPL